MANLALERGLFLKVWEHLLERMGVQASAGHVLCAGKVAALDHEDLFAGFCQLVGGNRAREPGSHHYCIEISHEAHSSSSSIAPLQRGH